MAANADFKYWYIKRDDDGFITEVAVRFYEGDMFLVSLPNATTGVPETKNVYVRTARIKLPQLTHLDGVSAKENQEDVKVYFATNFGAIKTEIQLSAYLESQMALDKTKTLVKAK